MPIDLTGTRVRLRALETRDMEPIITSYQDFDLALTTDGDARPMSDVQVRALWTEIIEHPGDELRYFAVEPLPNNPGAGALVGGCSLQHIDMRNRHAELAIFMISHEWRGQGYGAEAVRLLVRYGFEVARLDKIYLGVYDFNHAGLRAYERVGFRYEGRLRNMLYYEGRYRDEWHMGMLREEWDFYNQPPADGLRPFHPADIDAAVGLIQHLQNQPDREAARNQLQRWMRALDSQLYSFQVDKALAAVVSLSTTDAPTQVINRVYETAHQAALHDAIRRLATA